MQNISGISGRLFVFFLLFGIVFDIYGQDYNQEEQRIAGLLAKVEKEHRAVDELIVNNLTNLPVGIIRTVSNTKILIAIDSARLTPQGMIINAFTQVKLPGTSKPISFAARNVLITPSGISQSGATRLEVITEYQIPINDQVKLILPANGRNYIEWDCNGFRSVNFSGIFEFSDEYFTPDPVLNSNQKSVTAGFEVNTTDFNNIIVSTSITPFRVKGLGDMTFIVSQASVDMSDYNNCVGFTLPKDYLNIFSDAPQLWRGFFLKELTILLPSELSSSAERSAISASNLLIDEFGVSGYFATTNVLPFTKGNASGWPFSVDMIAIGLTQNRLTEGKISGTIGVPFLGNDTLGYSAQIVSSQSGLLYNFSARTNTTREYSIPLGGKVSLDKGSVFGMKAGNGKFIPSAILNGTLSIKTDLVKLDGLRFEGLYLTAESPYILGGKFASSGEADFNLAGFALSVNSISLGISAGKAALAFDTKVALMNRSEKGISASTGFKLTASMETNPNPSNTLYNEQKWVYDGILLQKVKIKGSVSIFSLNGSIELVKSHPVYGDGFHGVVGLAITKILKDTANVEIYFGTRTDYKYWFAKIDIPTNIPIGLTAITLKKLGGGAYNNMERKDFSVINSDYIPQKDAGLGFMAQVGLCVKDEKIFYADASFEIAFNKNGGVKFILFSGDGQFFSGDVEVGKPVPVAATMNMVFDNVNDAFHANLKVYMNIANAIKGIGPGGLLGEAVIHSDPADWYIYIGRPYSPLGIDVLGLFKTQSYIMAGTKIESMPVPPSEVESIIKNIDMDFMKSESGIATGRGMAFGIRFSATAGIGKEKGFVYAYFNAGAGADIMLQNYGTVECTGRSGPIGIDGWYASGQGYAYLIGKIGVRVKKSEFDIMSVATALLLQAKMPNPSWFQGNIAARYSILGGLIKGKVNVAVTLGEECVMITNGNELGEIKLIGDIKPAEGNREVDVFAAPQVSFNTTVDKEFGMVNIADQYAVYRVKLDQFKLLASDDKTIPGTVQWNDLHDMATLKLQNILPGKQQITASVKVHIEKKTSSGWQPLTGDSEVSEVRFVTGDEPKSINNNNVVYSYPVKNQYNFYRNEYSRGYIKLGVGQPNLFRSESEGNTWRYLARFKSSAGNIAEASVTYSDAEAMVYFDIPKSLSTSVVYNMTIVKTPVLAGAMDRNLQRSEVIMAINNTSDSLSMARNLITGTITAETETVLHSCSFRTSMYTTFADKLSSMTNWEVQSAIDNKTVDRTYMSLPHIKTSLNETFDKYEIEGFGTGFDPLVFAEAQRGTFWIDSHVNPQVYELYGKAGITLNRNTNVLGVFPLKAMLIFNSGERGYLLNNMEPSTQKGEVYIAYYVPHYVYTDFSELRNKAASLYLGTTGIPPQAQRLLAGSIHDISGGSYPFKINYRLPGLNIITTTKEFNINY